eukprot:m.19530 g.19530  ORF g.19530 m.19530 type:complete len:464 (+) comp8044_c0_seq1:96-1487(+)
MSEGCSVFVGNVSWEATEEELREIFSRAGPVKALRLVADPATGKPRGFGFVEYFNPQNAQSAIRNINGELLKGRALRVDESSGRGSHPRGSSNNRPLVGGVGMPSSSSFRAPAPAPPTEATQPTPPFVPETKQTVVHGPANTTDEQASSIVKRIGSDMPVEQVFAMMKQLKAMAQRNPYGAKELFSTQPQLCFAVVQALIRLDMINKDVAEGMLKQVPSTSAPQQQKQQQQAPPTQPSKPTPQPPTSAPPASGPPPGLHSRSQDGPPPSHRPPPPSGPAHAPHPSHPSHSREPPPGFNSHRRDQPPPHAAPPSSHSQPPPPQQRDAYPPSSMHRGRHAEAYPPRESERDYYGRGAARPPSHQQHHTRQRSPPPRQQEPIGAYSRRGPPPMEGREPRGDYRRNTGPPPPPQQSAPPPPPSGRLSPRTDAAVRASWALTEAEIGQLPAHHRDQVLDLRRRFPQPR